MSLYTVTYYCSVEYKYILKMSKLKIEYIILILKLLIINLKSFLLVIIFASYIYLYINIESPW